MRSGPRMEPSDALIVTLARESESASSKSEKKQSKPVTRQAKPRPPLPHKLPVKPPIQIDRPLDLIPMTKEELAAADISRVPKAGSGSGSGPGSAEGDSEVVGRGPNGDVLYAADWARKPTSAELGGYLPPNAPDGYGLVACKTLPQNRVEDCIELESRPRGSHLASAVRQAAWQFRVRPPRKNGRDLIGEWVRIQIFYTHSTVRIE
jgi:periplasmic protein TonB